MSPQEVMLRFWIMDEMAAAKHTARRLHAGD